MNIDTFVVVIYNGVEHANYIFVLQALQLHITYHDT